MNGKMNMEKIGYNMKFTYRNDHVNNFNHFPIMLN